MQNVPQNLLTSTFFPLFSLSKYPIVWFVMCPIKLLTWSSFWWWRSLKFDLTIILLVMAIFEVWSNHHPFGDEDICHCDLTIILLLMAIFEVWSNHRLFGDGDLCHCDQTIIILVIAIGTSLVLVIPQNLSYLFFT